MPNWCENCVTLTNTDVNKVLVLENILKSFPSESEKFAGNVHNKGNIAFFEHYLPRPNNTAEDDTCWNQKVWGTKWEPEIISFSKDDETTITIVMDTAWSPPIGIYEHFVKTNWVVTAFYHEPEYAFCGKYTNEMGDEYYEYDTQDMTTINKLPKDVLDFTCILDNIDDNYGSDEEIEGENDDEFDDKELHKQYKNERNSTFVCLNKTILSHKETRFINELEEYISLSMEGCDYDIFNLLFPRPEELDEDENILDWNQAAWGTRCEPDVSSMKRINDNTIEFSYKTSYTPPIKLYNFLVEEEWTVKAFYHQKDAQFCGCFTNDNGNVQYDYNDDDNSSIARIPHDIREFANLF